MIGLDTNVLIRLITNDDPVQASRARAVLSERTSPTAPALVSDIVLIETVWVLSRVYRYAPDAIANAIAAVMEASNVEFEMVDGIRRALREFQKGADFADALIGERNRTIGASTTVTFDRHAAASLRTFELIE